MRLFTILALLVVVLTGRTAAAVERFVSATGTGTTCSLASPCSLSTALSQEASGDILTFRGGTYVGTIVDTVTSGTSSARTTLRNFPGETVTLQGNTSDCVVYLNNKSWILIEGIHLNGNGVAGFGLCPDGSGSNNIFRNFRIYNNRNQGMLQGNTQHTNLFENLDVGPNGGTNPGFQHGLYLGAGTGHIIRGCVLHDHVAGYGMQLWPASGSNVIVENNVFRNNEGHLYLSGTNTLVRNNVFYGAAQFYAIVMGNSSSIQTLNNSITGATECGIVSGSGAGAGNQTRNNIVFGNGSNICTGHVGVQSNNLTTNPLWTNPAAGDFTLQAGSPAINAGMTLANVPTDKVGTPRPQGAAYEIGAYEFSVGAPPTIAPPFGLLATHTCGTASNALTASVLGSLFYLPTGASTTSTALVQSRCASSQTWTAVASVLQSGFSTVKPFDFLGTAGPNTSNVCTNCLSVHNGTLSTNAAGSGWTLPSFREGSTVAAATGGLHAMTLLPGLCTQFVEGTLTATPLWPWPLDARIATARALAGRPALSVTSAATSLFGPLPQACLSTPPPNPSQTTWVIAPTGVDGAACTLEAPCATFAHVGGRMSSGHTLLVRGGTYAQRIATGTIPGGTSWTSPTTVAAYQNETVVLQVNTDVVAQFTTPATDRYVVLDRLILDGSASTSTSTNGLHVANGAGPIRFQNGQIRNTHFERVLINGGVGVELLNTTLQGGTSLAAVRVQGNSPNFLLADSTIQTSPSTGVWLDSATLPNARITRTVIRDNAETGLRLRTPGVQVENTLVTGNALGVHVEAGTEDAQLLYLTIADNATTGLQLDAGALDTVVRNTILFGNGTNLVDAGTRTVQTTNLTTDPGFVGGGSYRIATPATSPAVDDGTCLPGVVDVALDGTARPSSACDIGVYEQVGSAGPPAPGALSATPRGASGFHIAQ